MERRIRSKCNTQIYEEACEWFVDFRGGDVGPDARREFDLWVRKSPEHVAAYLELAAIWHEGPRLDPEREWTTDVLIAEALDKGHNVVSLARSSDGDIDRRGSGETHAAQDPETGTRRLPLAAAFAAVCLVGGALLWFQLSRASVYTTATGEQRSIALPDGSVVELNARSRIHIRYSKQERDVDLIEGQALFQVARDQARPFIVSSDGTHVRAVGTQFDVYQKQDGLVVTVVEGRVAVLRDPGEELRDGSAKDGGTSASASLHAADNSDKSGLLLPQPLYLAAGEQLTVTAGSEQKTAHPNIASATAWTRRQLMFEAASLPEVVAEYNRYNERRLVIRDPAQFHFHISGVFSATDPDALLRFLRQRSDMKVLETASEVRVEKNNP